MDNQIRIGNKTFSEKTSFFANSGGQQGGQKGPSYNDPKKYLYDKKLMEVLDDMEYAGRITDRKKIKDSYAILTNSKSMIIIYVTSDGMYVVTKLNPSTGAYVGAKDVEEPNAVICGPQIIREAIDFVESHVKDNTSIFRKLWRYYFGGPTTYSVSDPDSNRTFSIKEDYDPELMPFADDKQFADKNDKDKDKDKKKDKKKNNNSGGASTAHSTVLEQELLRKLEKMMSDGLVKEYKKIGKSYAVSVKDNRAIFVYITETGDFILSKFNKETGGYIGANSPKQLNAIITGSQNFERAFRTMLYKVKDQEGFLEKMWKKYFT